MSFPQAAFLLSLLFLFVPLTEAQAVQACVSEDLIGQDLEGLRPTKKPTSELCEELKDADQKSSQPDTQDSLTAKTTVLIMLLRAYAEAAGEMH